MKIIRNIRYLFRSKFNGVTGRILSGTSWVLLGSIISKALVFLATIIIARILSKEIYGQLSIIRSTIQLFVGLSGFGIGATATKFIAEYRKNNPQKAINMYFVANAFVWVMAIVSCCLLVIFSSFLATERLHQPELTQQLRIAGIILFFTLLNGAQTGTLSGFEDFKRIAKCNAVMGVSEIVLLCVGAYLFGLTGAVVGFGLTYCIAWVYNSIGIRKHLRSFNIPLLAEIKKVKLADFKVLCSFSLPLAATSWIQMLTYWWMKTSVVSNSGFENMANYDVAEQWKNLILMIPSMVAIVILPILSNVNNDLKIRNKVIRANMYVNLCITGMLTLFIWLFGKWMLLLYGTTYTNAWPLYILSASTIFDSVSSFGGTILISSNKVTWALVSNTVWAIALSGSYALFINYVVNLENGLALSYATASIAQALVIVIVIKLKKLL